MSTTGAPAGFAEAVGILNRIPQDVVAEMSYEVTLLLQYKIQAVDVDVLCNKLETVDPSLDRSSLQSAVGALTHVYKSAAKSSLSPEMLSRQLKESLLWSEHSIAAVKHVWKDQGQNLTSSDAVHQLFSVGQFVDMKWKLGVAMSSDSCKNLNSPIVTVTLKVANPSGEIITKTFELTVPEFQNFSGQMKEMSKVLDTV